MTTDGAGPFAEIWRWLGSNDPAVEALASILSLGAIVIAARQVSEASAQRDVANSFEVLERFGRLLAAWSDADASGKTKRLGDLLGAVEVAAGSLIHRRFSKVTRYFALHLLKDALCLIVEDEESESRIRDLMSDGEVCRQVRLFLALNFAAMKRLPSHSKVYATFFAGEQVMFLWDDTWVGMLARRWYARRIIWGHV
jgi:hypothetical protein